MTKTDWELAQDHKYVVQHGEKPAVGASTLAKLMDNGKSTGMAFKAALITSEVAFDNPPPRTRAGRLKYVNWLRYQFMKVWDKTKDDGQDVHDLAMQWWQGKDINVPPHLEGYIDALHKAIIDLDIEPIMFERVVIYRKRPSFSYGGRFDLIAVIHTLDGRTYLIDIKTGKRYLDSVTLQLNYYAHAELAEYDEEGNLVSTSSLPPLDGLAVLYLHNDGTYEFLQLPFTSDEWEACKGLRYAYGWRKGFKQFEKEHALKEEK